MNKILLVALSGVILTACGHKPLSVTVMDTDNSHLIVVDESLVSDEKELYMSDIAEDFRIVRFDRRDDALLKRGYPYFSDNYIAVKCDDLPAKLFRKDGSFVSDIGGRGGGPGEYDAVSNLLIDEAAGRIYLLDFRSNVKIYNLAGEFLSETKIGGDIHKGKLFRNDDGTLSVVHLCFADVDKDPFVAATFNPDPAPDDTVRYSFIPQLGIKGKWREEGFSPYDNEVWSYRSSGDRLGFHTTFNDTLYYYDALNNKLDAGFLLNMSPERKDGAFFVYQELPDCYIATIAGGDNKGNIFVDKNTLEAWRVSRKVNDYFFDLGWGFSINDGYTFAVYEPLQLAENLQKAMDEGKIADDRMDEVRAFIDTLDEDDNDIMIMARLKRRH